MWLSFCFEKPFDWMRGLGWGFFIQVIFVVGKVYLEAYLSKYKLPKKPLIKVSRPQGWSRTLLKTVKSDQCNKRHDQLERKNTDQNLQRAILTEKVGLHFGSYQKSWSIGRWTESHPILTRQWLSDQKFAEGSFWLKQCCPLSPLIEN